MSIFVRLYKEINAFELLLIPFRNQLYYILNNDMYLKCISLLKIM